MQTDIILQQLTTYKKDWIDGAIGYRSEFIDQTQTKAVSDFTKFVESNPDCFLRSHLEGHVTGSALVVSKDFTKVLLTLHAKLGIWLQLGGHADGDNKIHDVALREAHEESGLGCLRLAAPSSLNDIYVPTPFDIDIHEIPQHKDTPGHYHYDMRFIVIAKDEALAISEESLDLKWFTIDEARKVTAERSMHRQFDKFEYIRPLLIN